MRKHGLRQQHQIETDSSNYSIFATRDRTPLEVYEQRVYRRCDLPPLTGADPDGYLEISATIMEAYPPNSMLAAEASGVGLATRISAPCRRLRLDYVYRGESPVSVTAESGRAVRAFGGQTYTDPLPLEVRPTEAVVLHNGKYDLKAVRCLLPN